MLRKRKNGNVKKNNCLQLIPNDKIYTVNSLYAKHHFLEIIIIGIVKTITVGGFFDNMIN